MKRPEVGTTAWLLESRKVYSVVANDGSSKLITLQSAIDPADRPCFFHDSRSFWRRYVVTEIA